MKKITERTLESALLKASVEFGCSVADLEYEVIQNPSSGFLGLGKKEAIIIVDCKKNTQSTTADYSFKQEAQNPALESFLSVEMQESITNSAEQIWGEGSQLENLEADKNNVMQIEAELRALFALLPFLIDRFEVRLEADNTLFVYIDGQDCALLIGEKGYRYRALSYLLFNWINPKYGYSLRLEIAEFLKNQEEMISIYLRDVARNIRLNGRAQTKVLDGILVYIALNKLREMFPDKYVSVRQNDADEKYIIVNDFRR